MYSFYNGVLVLKLPIGKNAASFGIILMGDEVSDADTVRHEYGHIEQLNNEGWLACILTIALPSLAGNMMLRMGKIDHTTYYSLPWEYEADKYVGVIRKRTSWADDMCNDYFVYWRTDVIG